MRPILCDESRSLIVLASSSDNGLGRLECLDATTNEAANGKYVATIVYPVTGKHFKDLRNGGIVKMKANDFSGLQMFRIREISKPSNGKITIQLNHITYDLNKTSVMPFESIGAVSTLQALKNNMVLSASYPFVFETNSSNNSSKFKLEKPQSVRACLGGVQGSFLDTFGGIQFEWDNLTVKANTNRGHDRDVRIAYGKNITDLKQEENIDSMYTAVQPYVVVDDITIVGDLQTIVAAAYPKILNLDLTSYFNYDATITKEMINAAAQSYIESNNLSSPKISIDVKFLPLWQTEEYKDIAPLERVGLFDTVKILFPPLGVEASAMVTEYVYNVLEERYESVHLGNVKSTLGTTIKQIVDESMDPVLGAASRAASLVEQRMEELTETIANSMGLFYTKTEKANGGYQYYLHDQPLLANSQYQWTINAGGFAVSQDYGQTWSAGISAQGEAVFNSVWTMKLVANQIITGILQDAQHRNYWNMDTGEFALSAATTVGGNTVEDIADAAADAAYTDAAAYADDAISDYDISLTQLAVFNKLTNNGQTQGIYLSNGLLYINANYINTGGMSASRITSGTMSAARINGGTLTLGGNNNTNGVLRINNASGTQIGTWNKDGITASNANLTGTLNTKGSYEGVYINNGIISFYVDTINQAKGHIYSYNSGLWMNGSSSIHVGDFYVNGSLSCSGTKPRRVTTQNYDDRLLYCYEMPSPMFGDIGEAWLDELGECYIDLEDIFSEAINSSIEYQVFLQKEGQGDIWVDVKEKTYFVVKGTPNMKFSWEIKAKQRDYEFERTEYAEAFKYYPDSVIEDMENQYMFDYYDEVKYVEEYEGMYD